MIPEPLGAGSSYHPYRMDVCRVRWRNSAHVGPFSTDQRRCGKGGGPLMDMTITYT